VEIGTTHCEGGCDLEMLRSLRGAGVFFEVKRGVRQILLPLGSHAVALRFQGWEVMDSRAVYLRKEDLEKYTRMIVRGKNVCLLYFSVLFTFFRSSRGGT
jgi:hypothetical protein